MNKTYTIYKHTSPSGGIYIGITKHKPEARWGKNGRGYKGGYFKNVIKKYGWNNITHEIVQYTDTLTKVNILEKMWISYYKKHNYKVYNLTDGGDGSVGYKHTEESKQKMSIKRRGEGNVMYGKKHTDETKKKMSDKSKLRTGILSGRHKEVLQFDKNGNFIAEFVSVLQASKAVGCSPRNIAHVCNGEQKTAKRYKWMYKQDYKYDY